MSYDHASNRLIINELEAVSGSVQLFDLTGRLMFSGKLAASTNVLNLPTGLVSGVYLARVSLSDGSQSVEKLIVHH